MAQSPSPAASPMDVDDLLSEILLRLAPLPSSLPRASLVCNRWRRLVTDPGFLRRFRAHHWKPLGVFFRRDGGISFSFFLAPRGPELFSVRAPRPFRGDCIWEFSGGRDGRVVHINRIGFGSGTRWILVWNPVTGEEHLLEASHFLDANQSPYRLRMVVAVICASGHRGPFKLALAWDDGRGSAHICVYSSDTGVRGNVASTAVSSSFHFGRGNVMVGNTLYWMLFGSRICILEFDLSSEDLSVIEVTPDAVDYTKSPGIFLCTLAKGGGLSLMVMKENLRGHLWVWEKTAAGVFQWMRGGTIELDMIPSLRSEVDRSLVVWLDGDDNVIFVSTYKGIFMVHLQSMQFEKIFETGPVDHWSIHPFKYLHAPGDILHQGGVGRGIQGSRQGDGEDRANRQVPHVSIKDGRAQNIAGLKRTDEHVSWEGHGPIW